MKTIYQEIEELRDDGFSWREVDRLFSKGRSWSFNQMGSYHYVPKPKVEYICYSCNSSFFRRKKSENSYNFCRPCWKRYFTRKSGTVLEGMDHTREIARIRDNHTCQDCGKIWIHGQRRFDIHHLNGLCGKRSRKYEKVRDLDILITLCHKFHLNLDEVKERMTNKSSPRPDKFLPVRL